MSSVQSGQRVYSSDGQSSFGGGGLRGLGVFLIVVSIIGVFVDIGYSYSNMIPSEYWISGIILTFIAGFILTGFYIIPEWIRVPVLMLGRYKGLRGPGIFWLVPLIYTIPYALDLRIITSGFSAEKTLTKDNVPVNVDAVLFWQVVDPFKAAIKVQDYRNAITWAAQTSLRDVIGKTDLSQMLIGRQQISVELQSIIDVRTEEWGVKSIAVELRDVVIPEALQDAMSRQAQAERERQARIILASSEEQIAEKFLNAAHTYESNATALNLRAMNILYESMKEKGAWIIVPSEMVKFFGGRFGANPYSEQPSQQE
jgi:regulator of protease activity HflC (stomatin/prohibitin superfamily)